MRKRPSVLNDYINFVDTVTSPASKEMIDFKDSLDIFSILLNSKACFVSIDLKKLTKIIITIGHIITAKGIKNASPDKLGRIIYKNKYNIPKNKENLILLLNSWILWKAHKFDCLKIFFKISPQLIAYVLIYF